MGFLEAEREVPTDYPATALTYWATQTLKPSLN